MVLPHTYGAALFLMILSMICWGSWANTLKLSGKWRFELFYFDYSFGVILTAVIAALTFGSLGFDGFLFRDDLLHTGLRQIFYGAVAGVIFNLANMLLVAAISVAGLAVAFPVGVGLALIIGVIWNYFIKPQGNPVLLFTGVAIIVVAIIADAMAYRSHEAAKLQAEIVAGKTKSTKRKVPFKGILLSLIGGVFMGSFYPLVEMGKAGEVGMGPYAIGFVFSLGLFFSTFVFNLFFMNLPVQGEPIELPAYLKGTLKQHLLGVLGGVIWCVGTLSNFVAASAAGDLHVGPAISYAFGQGATMISALWGLLLWTEFAGADLRTKLLLGLMLVLFVTGLAMVSVAPLYAPK